MKKPISANRTAAGHAAIERRREEGHEEEIDEDAGEEDAETGRKGADQVGEDMADPKENAVRPPLGQEEREHDRREAAHGHREKPDEGDERGQLGRKDRTQPDRQGREIDEVPAVGEEHLPFEERDDAENDHHEEEDVVLLLPGRVHVGRKLVLEEEEHLGAPPHDDRQEGQDGDQAGLHLVLEVHDIVPEKPSEEVLGQDPGLGEFLPEVPEAEARRRSRPSIAPLHRIDDPVGGQGRILVHDQLAEDLGQRGKVHEAPQVGHGIVGHDVPLMKDDDPRADLLRHFEDVGGIDDDLVLGREPADEVPHDECSRDVESREGFVEEHHLGIVGQGGGDQDLLAHALREGGEGPVEVVIEAEEAKERFDLALRGAWAMPRRRPTSRSLS